MSTIFFVENVKFLRQQRGFTQRGLAAELKINPETVFNYENCKTSPNFFILLEFAQFFNVTLDELVFSDLKARDENEKNSSGYS